MAIPMQKVWLILLAAIIVLAVALYVSPVTGGTWDTPTVAAAGKGPIQCTSAGGVVVHERGDDHPFREHEECDKVKAKVKTKTKTKGG